MTIVRRLAKDGDMTFGLGLSNFAVASEACAQNVATRIQTILGEWFLDTSAGVPYIEQVFNETSSLQLVEATLKKTIIETTDVQEILSFSLVVNHGTRIAAVQVSLTTVYNDTLNITVIS